MNARSVFDTDHGGYDHAESEDLVAKGERIKENLRRKLEEERLAREHSDAEPVAWETPVPLDRFDGPAFPVELMPSPFREWCEQCAESVQVPVDLPGMLNLALVGSIGAKRFVVPYANGYAEPLTPWVLVALDSASRKSSTFGVAVAPLRAWEQERTATLRHGIAEYRARVRSLKSGLKQAEEKLGKSGGDWTSVEAQAVKRISAELSDLEAKPVVAPRLIVDDITPEKLADIAAEQGGRILIASPEGGTFDLMAGRYSANGMPNLDFYVKGKTGDDHRSDRVGREGSDVIGAHVTMALTAQPEVLRGLSARPSFRGRGIIGRFWYSVPKGRVGFQSAAPPAMDEIVRLQREDAMRALLNIPVPAEPYRLMLDASARRHHEAFHNDVQKMMREGGRLSHMTDWGGRAGGGMLCLAGILHLMEHATKPRPWEVPINGTTALRAWHLMDQYLIPHAEAALAAMGASPERHLAGEVVEWIKRHRRTGFSRNDLNRHLRRNVSRPGEWEAPLGVLVEHGIVREVPTVATGGRPTKLYEVNPALFENGGAS